tara:strand:+ start:384 stop:1121 length:738 start_codon:yes stop_codon:yes gene_type:complete
MKVAIVIPCYNSSKYIHESLASALGQTYKNTHIYAYDNESTDGTLEILKQYESNNQNLTVINVKNIYPNSYREAFDHAFQNLDVDYITFLASDDKISETYVENCVKIFRHAPDKIKCIQSPIVGFEEKGVIGEQSHTYKNLNEFKKLCKSKSPVNTPTVFYKKELFKFLKTEAHDHENIEPSGAGDYDMFCSLANNNIFIYPIPRHMGYFYRWHPDQCTWKVHAEKNNLNYDMIIQKYWSKKWNL